MNLLKKIGKEVISTTTGIDLGSSNGPNETWYVTAIRAEGIKDKDRWTKSDPYLVVSLGSKTYRTRTINNDLSPQWNETFTFKVPKGKSKDIHLKLKDDDFGIDDTIGTAVVSAADLPMYSGEEKSIQVSVKKNEEIHGIVYLRVKKFVEGERSSYSSQQSQSSYQNYPPPSTQYQQQQPYQNYQPQQQQQQQPYQNYQQQQPSYQNYQQQQQPSYQNYQQQQSSYQNYQPQQQQQQQRPSYQQSSYGQYPQYQQQPQQQQNYSSAGYSSMPPPQSSYSGYNNNNNQQQQQRQQNQYPYQQYNQGYNQGYSQGYNQDYRR